VTHSVSNIYNIPSKQSRLYGDNYFSCYFKISEIAKVKEELKPVIEEAKKSLPNDVLKKIESGDVKPFLNHLKTIVSSSEIGYLKTLPNFIFYQLKKKCSSLM